MLLGATLFASVLQLSAQNITGKIVDKSNKSPLEFVNIALYKEGSDKMVKGLTSSENGQFTIDGVAPGTYELRISFVGYSTVTVPVVLTAKKNNINLGSISLSEDSQVLKEVQVTGQRSQMRFEVDKKVFSVDQNIASAGGSASDALSNIPSVSVDNEGNVSLRNNSAVTIWINGRPSGLSEENRAQILEQLPAESIESVEVITNPSARFSAEGSAGIINIVMKKEKKMGYFGGVSANADSQGGYGATANINLNYNKLETYANIGYRNRQMNTKSETERTSWRDDQYTVLNQTGKGDGSMGGLFGRLGMTYSFTDADQLSFGASTMQGKNDRNNTINYQTIFPGNDIERSIRSTKSKNDMSMYSGTMDYSHQFGKNHDLKISAEFDYMDRSGSSDYNQNYGDTIIYQLQDNPSNRKGFEAQIDYSNQLSEGIKIEAGYKGDMNWSRSDAQTWNNAQRLPQYEDVSLYNIFRLDQNIQALYATASGKIGNLSYQGGLRGEYTHQFIESTGKHTEASDKDQTTRNYFDLFPSAFLSYSLPHGNELQVNYTRRINRPRGRVLNSFINLTDSANISFGNPLVKPEFTHSLELNYIKNWDAHMVSASIYYRATSDVIQNVSYLEGKSLYSTFENVTNSNRSGVELVGKNRLFGFLDLTTTANLYYYRIDAFDFMYNGGQSTHYAGTKDFSWDVRMIANVMLPWGVSLQLNGNYTSPVKSAQGKEFERYWLDAGLRKSFMQRKLTVAITGRDLLDSRKMKSYRYGDNFEQYSTNQWGGRQIGVSVSYNFGNMKTSKKKNQQNGRNEDVMGGEMMED